MLPIAMALAFMSAPSPFVAHRAVRPSTSTAFASRQRPTATEPGSQQTATSAPAGYATYVYPAPPRGFNPLTATAAQLAAYGLPQRPAPGPALGMWTQAMRDITHYVSGASRRLSAPSALVPAGQVGNTGDINWFGYQVNSNSNGNATFDAVYGSWTVPAIAGNSHYGSFSAPGSWSDPSVAVWAGIGGGQGSSDIVQAGTISTATTVPSYHFVTEDAGYPYPGPGGEYPNPQGPVVYGGDTVYVQVSWSGGYGNFFLENESTGAAQSVSDSYPYFQSVSAECEGEWPGVPGGGYEAYLPRFSNDTVAGCATSYDGSRYDSAISQMNYIRSYLYNHANGSLMAYPYSMQSNGNFVLHWRLGT